MTTSTLILDPREINWHRQPGLYVTVLRSGLAATTSGISTQCHLMTINGLVTTIDQEPVLKAVPKASQAYEPSPEAPAVWLYEDLDTVFLVPAAITPNGVPALVDWQFGGNFAYRDDARFIDLFGVDAAVKIHDHREI